MKKDNSRGSYSSEYKAALAASLMAFSLSFAALFLMPRESIDLASLAVLIGADTLPLMTYGGYRTANKWKNGEAKSEEIE